MEERQVIVTCHRPEEKLPKPGEIVVKKIFRPDLKKEEGEG